MLGYGKVFAGMTATGKNCFISFISPAQDVQCEKQGLQLFYGIHFRRNLLNGL